MGSHDNYDLNILKALQRIANSLDRIEKKIPDKSKTINEDGIKIGNPIREDPLR